MDLMTCASHRGQHGAVLHGNPSFHSIIDLTADYYWEQNEDQRFVAVVFAKRTGSMHNSGNYLGRTFWELDAFTASAAVVWNEYKALFADRLPIRNFVAWHAKNAHEVGYISINGDPVFDNHGKFLGYRGVVRDISQEKRNEDYASTFELAAVGIAHVGANGKFIHANKKLRTFLHARPPKYAYSTWQPMTK